MNNKINVNDYKKIHFIGIGGVSVSALAEYTLSCGIAVSGSDVSCSERTERLKDLGATVTIGHYARNVRDADAVVYSVAVNDKNPEIRYAKNKRIPLFTRSEFLGSIVDKYKKSIAVAGCHGKTTTTAMLANVLICAGKDPTLFLGGDSLSFSNFRLGKSDYVITEACEYNKSFLDIKPKISVVLNVDDDHLDTYGNLNEIKRAFNEFIQGGISIVNADDINSSELYNPCSVTFGIKNKANYYATNVKREGDFYSFTLNANSRRYGKIKLKTFGEHNVYNALATFAVSDVLGIGFVNIKKGLESFNGVKRRNEYLASKEKTKFFADYAHHPKEIKATLSAHFESDRKVLTIFQPHTYSRTKLLMQDFISVLKNKTPLIIYKTYPAREVYDEKGSARALYLKLLESGCKQVYYADNDNELYNLVNELYYDAERVLVLGAGNIYEKVKKYLETNDKII